MCWVLKGRASEWHSVCSLEAIRLCTVIIFCVVCWLMKLIENYLKSRYRRLFLALFPPNPTISWGEQIVRCKFIEVRKHVHIYMARSAGNQTFKRLPFPPMSSGTTIYEHFKAWVGEWRNQRGRNWDGENYFQNVCEHMSVCVFVCVFECVCLHVCDPCIWENMPLGSYLMVLFLSLENYTVF